MDSLVLLSSLMLASCGGMEPQEHLTANATSAIQAVAATTAEGMACTAEADPALAFVNPRAAASTTTYVYTTCATNCGFTTCLYGGCCGYPNCKGTRIGMIKRCDRFDPRGGCLSGWYCVNQTCSTGYCCS